MSFQERPGLGELLRYLSERVDQGADARYRSLQFGYRARYTPVLRAIAAGAATVTAITEATHLTQGAVSQTLALMAADGIVARQPVDGDARKSGVRLTPAGHALLATLRKHWEQTFAAIAALEAEIGYPLRAALQAAAAALEREDFAERLRRAAPATKNTPQESARGA